MESNMSNATVGVILIVVVVFILTALLPNGPSHYDEEQGRQVGDHWIYPVNTALNGCLWMMAAIFVFLLIAGYALGLK